MRLPEYAERQLGNAACVAAITAADGAGQTLLPPLLHDQGKDAATIGSLVAVAAVVALAIRIPGGLLYRPERVRPLMFGSLGIAGLATFFHPLVTAPLVFAGIRLVYGLGYSLATTVNMAVFVESIDREADRRRSSGMYASAQATGYTVGNLAGGFLGQVLGFQKGYAALAVLWLVAMVPALARTPKPAGRPKPANAPGPRLPWTQAFRVVLFDRLLLSMVVAAFFINAQQSLFGTFTPLVLLTLGLGVSEVGIMRAVFSVTNAITRPIAGYVLDRIDHHRAQTAGILLNAFALLLFFLPLGFGPYLMLAITAGFGRAMGVVANTVALTQDIDPARVSRGVASGILNAALDLGNIIGPVMGGVVIGLAGLSRMWLIAPPLFACIYLASSAILKPGKSVLARVPLELAEPD